MAKKAPTAKQKAAQARLSKASKQASREGKKGKAFKARVAQLLKGTGGGGKGKSNPAKGSTSTDLATTSTNKKGPGLGSTYSAGKNIIMIMSPGTEVVLQRVTAGAPVAVRETLDEIGAKVIDMDYAGNVLITMADNFIDSHPKIGQRAALSRKSVTAWLPEAFLGLIIADVIKQHGGLTKRAVLQIHQQVVLAVNGYNVFLGELQFETSDFQTYRGLKHGGQGLRIIHGTKIGKKLVKPLKPALKALGVTV